LPKILKGRGLSEGIVEGEAIITKQPFNITSAFSIPLVSNSKKLKVSDRTHELYRKDIKDKVLIFPIPIGTTTIGFVLLEAIVRKIGPKAIICERAEPLLSSGALCAKIFYDQEFPIVDQVDFTELEQIQNGTMVRVNGNNGIIEIL